jgi:hypothetical protein
MINIAIDFDEIQALKFGKDYDPEEHVKEIFPALQSDSDEDSGTIVTKTESGEIHVTKKSKLNDGEGKDRAVSPEQQRSHEPTQQQSSPMADSG